MSIFILFVFVLRVLPYVKPFLHFLVNTSLSRFRVHVFTEYLL